MHPSGNPVICWSEGGSSTVKAAIIGGDLRQLYAADALERRNCQTSLFGLERCEQTGNRHQSQSLSEAVNGADFLLLPLPMEEEAQRLNAPFAQMPIALPELLECVPAHTPVFGGKVREAWHRMHPNLYDYAEEETFQIQNAVLTAEGALQLAMKTMLGTLHGSRCLVIGYGRIGKVLAGMLHGLGAQVCVSARRPEDRAWIRAAGYEALETGALDGCLDGMQMVFNTVPARILTDARLRELPPETPILDLASLPGGVDFEAARAQNRKVLHALALPGKTAPAAAGEAIADTVLQMLRKIRSPG